jgi:hypothetical protein
LNKSTTNPFPYLYRYINLLLLCCVAGEGRGLYYLKGGEFLAELTNDAQVAEYALHEVRHLVPNLQTDKNVLFIPHTEIAAFNVRQTRQHKMQ